MTESGFTFYCNLGMDLYMRMTRAKGYAKDILDGQPPVSYEDFMKFTKMKGLFTVAKEHCEPLVDFEDLPYAEANDYIDCMLDECSIMMRLHLSKPVGVDELCGHVDRRKMVSVDDFNKICLPDYDPRDRGDIVSFENKMQYRTDILYAMILVSAEMGLYGYD
jgi:hypothetical protein